MSSTISTTRYRNHQSNGHRLFTIKQYITTTTSSMATAIVSATSVALSIKHPNGNSSSMSSYANPRIGQVLHRFQVRMPLPMRGTIWYEWSIAPWHVTMTRKSSFVTRRMGRMYRILGGGVHGPLCLLMSLGKFSILFLFSHDFLLLSGGSFLALL
jgi:hypothetical protein